MLWLLLTQQSLERFLEPLQLVTGVQLTLNLDLKVQLDPLEHRVRLV